jgi:hypothetical protein
MIIEDYSKIIYKNFEKEVKNTKKNYPLFLNYKNKLRRV